MTDWRHRNRDTDFEPIKYARHLITQPFMSPKQIAVLTSLVSLYNLDEYIWKTYDVKSEEVFLYLKTGW